MSSPQEKKLTPQEIILSFLSFMKSKGKEKVSQEEIIGFVLKANCPSDDVALELIHNMSTNGSILREEEGENIYYSLNT